MQKEIEKIESQLADRIYKLFMEKYNGNKSMFAKASDCAETTVRRILRKEQGITVNLLIRMSNALGVTTSDLMKDLYLKKEE